VADDLRYPIGKWQRQETIDAATRAALIDAIAAAPAALAAAVKGLSDAQLDTPYREGGWTPRQIVHHLADSHMNAYVRMKLAATEENPTIKPYLEGAWAGLPDAMDADVTASLGLLDALHARWVAFARALRPADFERTLLHPERGPMTIDRSLALYAWHGPHHVAHITGLRRERGW
jgi:uncharacterized damage-inducible protein DinB